MIWASCVFHGCELGYLPALNPGQFEGRTWLIEYVGDVPIWLVLEAASASDALDVLNNDPEWGDLFHVLIAGDEDDPERIQGTQYVRVHGEAFRHSPYPVRYHDEGFPDRGIDPHQFAAWQGN